MMSRDTVILQFWRTTDGELSPLGMEFHKRNSYGIRN